MAFPSTDWPGSVDTAESRIDGIDIVWKNDFEYQDAQVRAVQQWLGTTGQLIGANVAGQGPGGMVSPIATGNTAFQLAARNDFASGKLLSVGDDYDAAYVEHMYLNVDGLLWLQGGLQIAATQSINSILDEDGLGSDSDTALATQQSIKAYVDNALGAVGVGIAEYDWVSSYAYTQLAVPVAETMGYGAMDASELTTVEFRVTWNPQFTVAGTAEIRLYDIGDADTGIPSAPVLITTITATASGITSDNAAITIGASPSSGQVQDDNRMYEVAVYQNSATDDTVFVGSAGITGR